MERSTSSLEEARANHSASQESEKALQANQALCSNTFELFKKSCLDVLSGKTCRERSRARKGQLSDSSSVKWMRSGTVWHGEYWTRNSSTWPNDASVCFLSDVLETQNVPQKYYLSAKACAGILRRAVRRGKPLPPQLKEALEAVAKDA